MTDKDRPVKGTANMMALRISDMIDNVDESLNLLRFCIDNERMAWDVITAPPNLLRTLYLTIVHLLDPKTKNVIQRGFRVCGQYITYLKLPPERRPIKSLSAYGFARLVLKECEGMKTIIVQQLHQRGLLNPEIQIFD